MHEEKRGMGEDLNLG